MNIRTFIITTILMACILIADACPIVYIAKYDGNCKAAISLTFDDGIEEHYSLIAPQLDKYGLKATFGINGKYIGSRLDSYAPRMTWQECRELSLRGHEISNHTWSHPNLCELDSVMIYAEIAANDSVMLAELGKKSLSVLYPYNAYNEIVMSICEKEKVGSRLYQFALGQKDSGVTRELIGKYIESVINDGKWGVTMTHGINTAWDQWYEPQVLWDLFHFLSDNKDLVWTDTFANVMAYIKERDATSLSVNPIMSGYVINMDCSLDSAIFNFPLTIIVEGLPADKKYFVTQNGINIPLIKKDGLYYIKAHPFGKLLIESH